MVRLPSLVSQIASITAQNSPSSSNGANCVTAALHLDQGSLSKTSHTQKRQWAALSRMSEPVGMIAIHEFHKDFAIVGVDLHGGRVILKSWSDEGVESHTISPRSKGYSCSLVLTSPRITRWSLVISLSMYQAPVSSSSLNVRFNFRMRRILPYDSSCFEAIGKGDLRTIQHQLTSRELRLTDSTSYGWNLLHVSVLCLGDRFMIG
jgi:hypothetical protein